MVTTTLNVIDANCYKLQLDVFAISIKKWHGELSDYKKRTEEVVKDALDACNPGTDMTYALNKPGTTLREATEELASNALKLLECTNSTASGSALGSYIIALEDELKDRQGQAKDRKVELKGKGAALVKTLRHINYLIGSAPHYKNESDEPMQIKHVSFPDLIAALESFQRALEDVYASKQTLSEVKLTNSAGCPQYSIYNQDGVNDLRNKNAEILKKKLDRDHADVLGTAYLLEQHGLLTLPRTSHDSFAESVFSPTGRIASSKVSIGLNEALASKAPVILIQGEGGCGKTVALWRFGLKTNIDSECEDIALYAKLDTNFPSSAFKEQIAEVACYANDSRHIYILLDGLDEIHSKRSRVAEAIANLIDKYHSVFWRISTRELIEDIPEETRVWHFFKMEPFRVDKIVSGIRCLDQISQKMRDHAVTLIQSEKPLASLLGTAFYYGLFCWELLESIQQGFVTPDDEPRQVFRSHLLKFGLDKYVERELKRSSLTAIPPDIDDLIITWRKAVLYELFGTPDTPRINANIINPASKHELFRDWLLASSLIEAKPQDQDVLDALTKMTGPRRRSVMSLMLEVLLIADKTNSLTETMFRVEPLIATAGFVRRNRLNARLAPAYYFNHILSATTLNDEFCESPWLKAVVSALMCGPTADSTKEAINEIAFHRVPTVPLSIQQTLGESAFWLLLDVQDAVYGTPKNIEKLAQRVFDCPEPWAELAKYGYNYWIHYRQRLAELPEVEQIARGAPVLKTNQSLSERQAVEKLPPPLQARYWLSLEGQIDYQDNMADRAGLSVTWLAQHCRELSLRLMHRLIVKHLVPDRSGEQQDFTALLEYAKKQAPLLLPELFNVLPKKQVYDALEDQGVLDQFVDQVTPTAAAQFFRHVNPSGGPHDATCQEWRERVMQSLRNNSWCEKADPAEMQRLFEIGLVEPLSEAKKNRWQQSMHMRDAGLLKRVGVQIECTRECVEAWVNQAHSSKDYFHALDAKAITPANAIDSQDKPILQKVIDELNESAILTLLQRTGGAAPAQEITDAIETEAKRRFNEAIENFDTTNSQHNWCAIIRIFQKKLRVDEMPEGGQKWLSMLSQAMKAVLLRQGLITIKEFQIAEQASHAKGDRPTSYTYLVSHRDDDHCWLLYLGKKTQPMFPTRKYSDVSSGESRLFEINVGDAVLLRSHGFWRGARHVACAGASISVDGNSNEVGDRGLVTSLSLDERLKRWIHRSLHPVYSTHECFNNSTPFNHNYWGQQGVTIQQWLIPTRLSPDSSLASLNHVLAKGWFVVKLCHEDVAQQFWKCQGPLMGKDVYLRSRDIIGKINGQQPRIGDFLLARIQVRMHIEKSECPDGYVPVLAPVVSGPFAYLLPKSLVSDTESAWWKRWLHLIRLISQQHRSTLEITGRPSIRRKVQPYSG